MTTLDHALLDRVRHVVEAVAAEVVMPRFRALTDDDLRRKAGDELVTIADVEAEAQLAELLPELRPGLVVGEEGTAADPGLLARAGGVERCWVVDPIDGTRQYAGGEPEFAVMVALVEDGVTAAAWIHQPALGRTFVAGRGLGAWVDGHRLARRPAGGRTGRAALGTRLLPPEVAARVLGRAADAGWAHVDGPAGLSYPRMATGELDLVFAWRVRPWDHLPGALLVEETGGRVSRLDGSPYVPWADEPWILAARDAALHAEALDALAPDGVV